MRSDSFFANPSFRAHLLWVTTGFTAALLFVSVAAVFVPLFQRFDASLGSSGELERLTFEILDLHARLWPVVAVALFSTFACSWLLYARMRGPLFRFVAVFRALGAGSVPEPVVIRATDYVQEEAAALNALLDTLRAQSAARESALGRVEACAADLAEWASARADAEAIALAAALEAECKALRSGPRSA